MTIFDLLGSAGIKLAKLFKKGTLTEQQYKHFAVKLSNFIEELGNAINGEESS